RIEVRGGIEIAHLRRDLDAHVLVFESGERRDRAAAFAHASPDRARIVAKRTNRAHAGDDDTTIHAKRIQTAGGVAGGGGLAALSATSFSTVSTRPFTDSVSKLGSRSGIWILKWSSISKMIWIASSEGISRSLRVESSVTLLSSMPASLAMIAKTVFWTSSLMVISLRHRGAVAQAGRNAHRRPATGYQRR